MRLEKNSVTQGDGRVRHWRCYHICSATEQTHSYMKKVTDLGLSWSKIRTNQIARIIWHIVKTTNHLHRIKLWEARFCKGGGLQERERSVNIPCWRRAGNKNLAYQVRIVHNIRVIHPLWWLGPVYSKLSNSYSNFCWYLNIFALLRFDLTGQIIFYST